MRNLPLMSHRLNAWMTGLYFCLAIAPAAFAKERVISTDAAVTQILFALQLDADLVGVDVTSSLPPDYREVPNVGYHRALSAEGLLALNPTLVIGSEHLGPPNVVAALASADVPVVQLAPADSVRELKDNILRVANATHSRPKAGPLLEQIDSQAARLATTTLGGERIAFILSVEPGKLRIAGAQTAGNAFIALLGGRNIADFPAYRTLSAEAVLELAPAIILVAGHEGAPAELLLQQNPILRHAAAAKAGRILSINAANLVAGLSPDALAEAVALASRLHRELAAH